MNALIKRLFNLRNFSRNSHLPARRTLENAHGVTLVEIMLVLVISGIVFSGLITSYFNVQKIERNKEAIQQIETIKQAIVAYAATHKTANREIYVQVTLEFSEAKRAIMPAGRPYLPCPDVTGDGLEDRVTPPNPTESLTLSFANVNNARGFYEMDAPASQMRDYSLWYPGSCYSSRGIVPWRTLGTPSVDPWGNRHTYRVMPTFAGAAHGFDQNTPAVNVGAVFAMIPSTLRLSVTVVESGFSRQTDATLFVLQAPVSHPTGRYQGALAGGGNGVIISLSLEVIGPNFVYFSPAIICSQPPCPPLEAPPLGTEDYVGQIVAGNITVVSTESFPGLVEYGGKGGVEAQFTRTHPKVSGVPFVIVSHGRNGYGAVRGSEDVEYKCNPFPSGHGSTVIVGFKALAENSERANAVFSNTENMGCAVIAAWGQDNAGLDYGFIDGINHGTWIDTDYGYDDIVSWMSAEDLAAELGRLGVFPTRHLPLLTNQAGF